MITEWKKKDKKACREICPQISDEYLVYIDQNTAILELGTRLQGFFQSKAAIGIVNLCCEFFWTFTVDSTNMEEHVCKLHGLHQQLNCKIYTQT